MSSVNPGPYKLPKFLMGGVNFKHNFLGLRTLQTATYGWIELGIKVVPLFVVLYGVKHATTFYTPERD